MYENVGKSIKNLVKTIVTVGMIVWVVIGIVILATSGENGAILGILVAVVGCFMSWLSGLVLYAYGEMADNLKSIKEAVAGKEGTRTPTKPTAQSGVHAQNTVVTKEPMAKEAMWKCYSCGKENEDTKSFCVACNVTRRWSETQWAKKK